MQSFDAETVSVGSLNAAATGQSARGLALALPGIRVAGTTLPPRLAARAFGPAWVIAFAAHLALAALAVLSPGATGSSEEPLVRLVFFEPPPPPPAPLGIPGGAGSLAAPPEPKVPEVVPVQPKDPPVQVVMKPSRLKQPQPVAKAKPRPKAARQERPVVETAAADLAPGVRAGAVGGEPGGVVGGSTGGVPGGVVGGSGSGPVPAGQVAHPPQLVRRVAPVYPQQARRRQVEGLVLLEAILDRNGHVEPQVKVVESIPMLDHEAIAAVRKWQFRPARNQAGEPLRVILEIPIRFVLR